jgi:uncharacterized protein YecT (DUF1311 family)
MRHALTGDKGRRAAATTGFGLAVVLLAGWPSGCTSLKPVTMSPEAAFPACEAEALHEARRIDPTVQGVQLEPLSSAQVERRSPPPGHEGVQLVIQGHGSEVGGGTGDFRYACLVGTAGDVLFVSLQPEGAGKVMAECATRPAVQHACLRDLAASADRALADAEAAAVAEARRRAGKKRSEVDEPAAESIGAWRVYRDAECARRYDGGNNDRELACLVELTRARIAELRG